MGENPSNERQDPADTKKTWSQVSTEPQPVDGGPEVAATPEEPTTETSETNSEESESNDSEASNTSDDS